VSRIYVINLDRRPDRWKRVRRELDRFRDRDGERLSSLARRFSAVDARYLESWDPAVLNQQFTLADQLAVHPNALLQVGDEARSHQITMTDQEVAVALSHIEVWRLVAEGDAPNTLVLEDDVYFAYGFAHRIQTTWASLTRPETGECDFDLLYLAFNDVRSCSRVDHAPGARRLHQPGIWEAAGYVLTRDGARKLLERLPANGPIDLWLNMQFTQLRAFTSEVPIIRQRIDEPSTNSYSVLPVLSQVGVITADKTLVPSTKHLSGPVVALGDPGTGLTALATALSMLGYTCLSDIDRLPPHEEHLLLTGKPNRQFNAYVNIGSIPADALSQIAKSHPGSRFIETSTQRVPAALADRALTLTPAIADKWEPLTRFLGIDYPSFRYPARHDLGIRTVGRETSMDRPRHLTDLKHDSTPWILKSSRYWNGIALEPDPPRPASSVRVDWRSGQNLKAREWVLRDDTFPSNMALFRPANISQLDDQVLLTIRKEPVSVRELTSGAIATRDSYRYGRFEAEVRPARTAGLVTGVFLHRNGPRQEIDIEFLGKDTTKMLINVFYNPGLEGTKLEYGYRGTPTLIDLGFDAAENFHTYEIDWQPHKIRWLVDGNLLYERTTWDPTPIPDQPLQFNVNLWHSRSREFAGRLDPSQLPISTGIRSIKIRSATCSALVEPVTSTNATTGETLESARGQAPLAPPRADGP
jgi:GR25 family glycosyltransferase involved in LPS biosynthesis